MTAARDEVSREVVVVVTAADMRSSARADAEVVSQATLGQRLAVLEADGNFARVRSPDGYAGWLSSTAFVEYPDPTSPRYATSGRVAEVTSLMASLYRDPDQTSAGPLLQAPLTCRVQLLDAPAPEGWLRVRLPAGDTCCVRKSEVRTTDAQAPRRRRAPGDIVATARRFLGVPYLWGGLTSRGIDCSGLASVVFRANGIELLRDAHQQFDDPRAVRVPKRRLRPGDLVFFGPAAGPVSHVGIYAGRGRFLSATTHGQPMVRLDSLHDRFWAAIYRGARRYR